MTPPYTRTYIDVVHFQRTDKTRMGEGELADEGGEDNQAEVRPPPRIAPSTPNTQPTPLHPQLSTLHPPPLTQAHNLVYHIQADKLAKEARCKALSQNPNVIQVAAHAEPQITNPDSEP